MDALDILILRELGIEPFIGWRERTPGQRTSGIAKRLGKSVQLVKDRIARMETEGVITGYRVFPNLGHLGLRLTVHHVMSPEVPSPERMQRLSAVDGLLKMVWFLDSGLCIGLAHTDDGERQRRNDVLSRLIGADGPTKVLYECPFPDVARRLDRLDWRIMAALSKDARRPLGAVAEEVGVTVRTVRNRLQAMRAEGSLDEFAVVDFSRVRGIVPLQMAVWHEKDASPGPRLVALFHDRYLAHFDPPEKAYAPFLVRVFAYTPAEVQALVRMASDVEGVTRVEPQMATGGYDNSDWVWGLVRQMTETAAVTVP
ncbi:MAG: winged helix-turn-helix transcriptional regulator [Euryarchaeota archaeon]|nr:winged helix-turn-helix transcriptional regulator [Euryarchaeota archaeon]